MHSRIAASLAYIIPITFLLAVSACDRARYPESDKSASTLRPAATSDTVATDELASTPEVGRESNGLTSETYNPIHENGFVEASHAPLSTFSIDVDPASYSNVRRFINSGTLPPPDAVRIEELVNYFTYDYPQPESDTPFSIVTETASCPWNEEHRLVLIGLQGKKMEMGSLPPSNLVFLIDVSGSMNEPDKLPLVKSSLRLLVNQLREEDRVAIVVYAGNSGLVLPSTPGSEKGAIMAAIDQLEAGGSTAGGAGIELAYKVAAEHYLNEGNNRVILATDGDFNVGVSDQAGLVKLIEAERSKGIFLTTLGFGTGNLQDGTMEQLADKGNGEYDYIDGEDEAQKIFIGQVGATLLTIAKDVKLQVEFNPALVKAYRLIGYENRMLETKDFDDDRKDAGEMGAGHSVTALYEIVPQSAQTGKPHVAPLLNMNKERDGFTPASFAPRELMSVKLRYKKPQEERSRLITGPAIAEERTIDRASDNIRFAAAVAEWGMLLRSSRYKGSASFRDVHSLAASAQGTDADGLRQGFLALVDASRNLAGASR